MSFDMKQDWSDADVARLLASVEDDRDWRLEVDKNGLVSLQDKTSNPTDASYDQDLHCFFELWQQGINSWSPASPRPCARTIPRWNKVSSYTSERAGLACRRFLSLIP